MRVEICRAKVFSKEPDDLSFGSRVVGKKKGTDDC